MVALNNLKPLGSRWKNRSPAEPELVTLMFQPQHADHSGTARLYN